MFVAEVLVPTTGYMPKNGRVILEEPAYFGVEQGYWRLALRADELGNPRPAGIEAVIKFAAPNFDEAEDLALEIGRKLATLFSGYLGAPLSVPSLSRVARIGSSGGVIGQRCYYYEDPLASWPRVKITPFDFEAWVKRIARQPREVQHKLQLAVRWYGVSIRAEDPVDSYLAVWVGLEPLGPLLDSRWHQSGARAPCKTCGNPVGQKRNRTHAGLEHLIRLAAPDLIVSQSVVDLANIRNEIAHGAKLGGQGRTIEAVRCDAAQCVPDLMLCLARAILTLSVSPAEATGSLQVALPRDYEYRPTCMVEILFPVDQVAYRPWFDEWIKVEFQRENAFSTIEASGEYVAGFEPRVKVLERVDAPITHQPQLDFVDFERRGFAANYQNGLHPTQRVWRDIPLTQAWKQVIDSNETKPE